MDTAIDEGVTLEQLLFRVLEQLTLRFDAYEVQLAKAGFPPGEPGVHPRVESSWTPSARYERDGDDHEDEVPTHIRVSFLQTYATSLVAVQYQHKLLQTIRKVYEPLAGEGLWLSVTIPLKPEGWRSVYTDTEAGFERPISYEGFRAELPLFDTDLWLVIDMEDDHPGPTSECGHAEDTVIVEITAIIGLVTPDDDGDYPDNPDADLVIQVPLTHHDLLTALALHRGGIALDDAVERVTGQRSLRF